MNFSKPQTLLFLAFFHHRGLPHFCWYALLICLTFIGITPIAEAQLAPFRQLEAPMGLPSETYDLLQDHQGILWISSDHGLFSFDGYDYSVLTTADGLPDNTVFRLYEDPKHRLWGTTLMGKVFRIEAGKVVVPEWNQQLEEQFGRVQIRDLLVDAEGTTQFFHPSGDSLVLVKVDSTGEVSLHALPSILPSVDLLHYLTDGSDAMLIEGRKNPRHRPPFNQTKKPIQPTVERQGTLTTLRFPKRVTRFWDRKYILRKDEHTLFFSSHREVFCFQKGEIIANSSIDGDILGLFSDQQGNLWVTSKNGVWQFQNGDLSTIPEHFFPNKQVSSFLHDREDNYWFSIIYEGVFRIPSLNLWWMGDEAEFPINRISAIAQVNEDLLLGSNDTLYQIQRLGNNQFNFEKLWSPSPPLIRGPINQILSLNEEELLISNGSAFVLNLSTKESRKITYEPYGLGVFVREILLLPDKTWLLMGVSKIFHAELNSETMQFKISASLNYLDVKLTGMAIAANKQVWVGSSQGLFRVSLQDQQLIPETEIDPKLNSRITDLKVDDQNRLWLATRGHGTAMLNLSTREVRWFNQEMGLLSNLSDQVFFPEPGKTWIASQEGINELVDSPTSGALKLSKNMLTDLDGLASQEFLDLVQWGDLVALSTNHGLHLFPSKEIARSLRPPSVHLKSIRINERDTVLPSNVVLTYAERDLEIDYSGICFRQPTGLQYRYQLEGLENTWHITTERRIHYSNLPAGIYHFRVFAINKEGQSSPKPAEFSFTVSPHFSQTWLFRMSIFVVVSLAIWLGMRLFIRNRLRKSDLEKRIVLSEQKALRAQMNPHFIFNTMNSIQQFIAINDKRSAYSFLSRSAQLIRNVLENSRSNFITLEQELHSLKLYLELESLRFGDGFEYTINVAQEIEGYAGEIRIPNMMIQPYLENAIWHGLMPKESGERKLTLSIEKHGNSLCVAIEDNGVGRKRAAELKRLKHPGRQSTAMENIAERTQLLNQLLGLSIQIAVIDLYSTTDEPAGTQVTLTIPPIP